MKALLSLILVAWFCAHAVQGFEIDRNLMEASKAEQLRKAKEKLEAAQRAYAKMLEEEFSEDDENDENDENTDVKPAPKPTGGNKPNAKGWYTEDSSENQKRRYSVVQGARHAWSNYERLCFGRDELYPNKGGCGDWLGLGLTVVDSLDTLWYMGLKSEYQRAKDWVKEKLVFQQAKKMVSFFETVIRLVGGLLSAYEVDPDQMYLTKCVELTDRLMHAFGPFGLPLSQINLATGDAKPASWARSNVLLAEVGTIQLEFCYLSEQTGDSTYAEAAERVIDIIDGERLDFPGLPRLYLNPNTGRFDANSGVSMGAIGDSYYEYLLKMWIWKNKKDPQYKRMYLAAMDGMFAKLIGEAPARKGGKRMFIGELDKRGSQVRKMDHLACFVPGMLALGLMHGVTDDPAVSDQHFRAAEELTDTCYAMYKLVPTGLAPESVQFLSSGMQAKALSFHQRPEAVEAFFYMWRLTHDEKYRDYGWEVWEAIENTVRVKNGYVSLKDYANPSSIDDKQESFFLAETLKYLYLLFSPDDALDLTEVVFNTEAHPLGIKR